MITGSCFFRSYVRIKVLGSTGCDLFVSRVLRLTPLYWVVVAIVGVIVGFETNFSLQEALRPN